MPPSESLLTGNPALKSSLGESGISLAYEGRGVITQPAGLQYARFLIFIFRVGYNFCHRRQLVQSNCTVLTIIFDFGGERTLT